ncbi:bacterial transcriptional activator domain-containing protein [Eubacterium sp. 1001713B170207_170306_E7]|uniref:bacterial transcriptional activator domain-containing protein n=1 Tax=Eubacterium sp. 1001713B170207_170306_E7 TaxID=2787097 RepID=UPI00189831CF|nr:bacterial transcriptional activator domain-containing protein [Eubacterium sp. 1001713B170207_170306_E7]
MYCLYKTLEWFKNLREQGICIPLITQRGTLGLDTTQIYSDLWEFEVLYLNRSQLENCQKAVDLYIGPLLAGAPYNWISAHEAHYELSCAELLEILMQQCKEASQLNIYQKKLEIITEP